MELLSKLNTLAPLVGNTPLVEISVKIGNNKFKIYAKCEMFNISGSIKDRCVLAILQSAIKCGEITPNSVLMEATSGNTGISLACMGAYLGNKVSIVMPKSASIERKKLMQAYGAKVVLSHTNMLQTLQNCVKKTPNAFVLRQFESNINPLVHYLNTAPEIIGALTRNHLCLSAFACGVGTGGTFMGIGGFLKKHYNVKAYALQSSNVDLLNSNKAGAHMLQGLASEFSPPLFNRELATEILSVNDIDAVYIAQKLCKTLGLGVGISSGANVLGSIMACVNYGHSNCATVLPDDNKKYLSTTLCEKVSPSKFAHSICFDGLRVI